MYFDGARDSKPIANIRKMSNFYVNALVPEIAEPRMPTNPIREHTLQQGWVLAEGAGRVMYEVHESDDGSHTHILACCTNKNSIRTAPFIPPLGLGQAPP